MNQTLSLQTTPGYDDVSCRGTLTDSFFRALSHSQGLLEAVEGGASRKQLLPLFKEENMRFSFMRSAARYVVLLALSIATFVPMVASASIAAAGPTITPLISDWQFLAGGAAPPNQTALNAVRRACFTPTATHNSYNYASLLAAGNEGQGKTIAIVDSFGSATIRNDLYVFSTQFGLPVPCGANLTSPSTPDGNCAA